jgi:hypothetical protein
MPEGPGRPRVRTQLETLDEQQQALAKAFRITA